MRYGERQIGVYLSDALFDELHAKVLDAPYDRTLSACVRALIRRWVRGEIKLEAKHVKPLSELKKWNDRDYQ